MARQQVKLADLAASSVDTSKIVDKTIAATDVADGIITLGSSLITDGSINANKVQNKTLTYAQIADGTIQQAQLVQGAATAFLGASMVAPSWSTTNVGSALATGLTLGVTSQGSPSVVFIEIGTSLYHSIAGGGVYLGIGWDNSLQAWLGYINFPAASGTIPVHFSYFTTVLAAGGHTLQLFVQNGTAGTLTINGAAYSYIAAYEFRK